METKSKTEKKEEDKLPQEAEVSEKKKVLSIEELTDLLKRTQANFENYRKQNQAYLEEIKKMAARDILLQVLPLLDNLELALKAVSKEQKNTEFVQGIELIHAQLMQLLQQNNVLPIETMGKDFDPYYHEALMKTPAEVSANKIIGEFQKGFTIHGRVLRHAKVKISAGPATKNTDSKNNEKNKEKNN